MPKISTQGSFIHLNFFNLFFFSSPCLNRFPSDFPLIWWSELAGFTDNSAIFIGVMFRACALKSVTSTNQSAPKILIYLIMKSALFNLIQSFYYVYRKGSNITLKKIDCISAVNVLPGDPLNFPDLDISNLLSMTTEKDGRSSEASSSAAMNPEIGRKSILSSFGTPFSTSIFKCSTRKWFRCCSKWCRDGLFP